MMVDNSCCGNCGYANTDPAKGSFEEYAYCHAKSADLSHYIRTGENLDVFVSMDHLCDQFVDA